MAEIATKTNRITKSLLAELAPGESVWDADVKGFGARRQRDQVSFFLKTRVKGRQRWVTIGRNGSPWSPETARKEAVRLLAAANAGEDPTELKRQERVGKPIFADFAETFIQLHGKKLKAVSADSYCRIMRLQLIPSFGKRRVEDITRSDVASFHAKWAHKPRTANLALAVMSKLMSFAEQQGVRPDRSNPCLRLERYRENKRERFLSEDELARLGAALDRAEGHQNKYILAAIRLLILTGARLNEILSMKWSYIDFERRMIRLPDSKTGAKAVPLNQPAIDILVGLDHLSGNPYVLPGHIEGAHLVNIQKAWRLLRAEANLGDVRLHDLRHSFASVAVAQGASLPILGKVLGHSQPQTTARYAHLADTPVSQLSEQTADTIQKLMRRSRCP